jgi:hypothetical protein
MFKNIVAVASLILLICSCHGTDGHNSAPTPNEGDLTGDGPPKTAPTPKPEVKPLPTPPAVTGDVNHEPKHYPKPKIGSWVSPAVTLAADHVATYTTAPGTLDIRAALYRGENIVALRNLKFQSVDGTTLVTSADGRGHTTCSASQTTPVNLEVRFENDTYKIVGHWLTYVLKISVQCGHTYALSFNQNSKAGNVLSIFETVERARTRLAAEVGLDFWNDRVTLSWPATSTFYDLGEVNLTHGNQYEVVGHELGHALADLGNINVIGPCMGTQCSTGEGYHLIDHCYNKALAFSEGWATFFSAWLYLDPNDSDAKFSQISPRRAPVRVENVPADVCDGPTNEWRVTAFLWSLMARHNNGKTEYSFAQIWNGLQNRAAVDTMSVANDLVQSGFSKKDIDQAWRQNFLTAL